MVWNLINSILLDPSIQDTFGAVLFCVRFLATQGASVGELIAQLLLFLDGFASGGASRNELLDGLGSSGVQFRWRRFLESRSHQYFRSQNLLFIKFFSSPFLKLKIRLHEFANDIIFNLNLVLLLCCFKGEGLSTTLSDDHVIGPPSNSVSDIGYFERRLHEELVLFQAQKKMNLSQWLLDSFHKGSYSWVLEIKGVYSSEFE